MNRTFILFFTRRHKFGPKGLSALTRLTLWMFVSIFKSIKPVKLLHVKNYLERHKKKLKLVQLSQVWGEGGTIGNVNLYSCKLYFVYIY